jgi:hypothetical protein
VYVDGSFDLFHQVCKKGELGGGERAGGIERAAIVPARCVCLGWGCGCGCVRWGVWGLTDGADVCSSRFAYVCVGDGGVWVLFLGSGHPATWVWVG